MIESHMRELLKEELVLKTGTKLNGKSLKIIESKNRDGDELCEFTILDLPSDSIAFTLDPDHTTLPKRKIHQNFTWLLKNEPKVNIENSNKFERKKIDIDKKCDFVLIATKDGICNIIIGELKSEKLKPKIYQSQLRNSYMIVKYVIDLLETYYLNEELSPIFRLVVFSSSKKIDRSISYNSPYKYSTKIPVNMKEKKLIVSVVNMENGVDKKFDEICKEIEQCARPYVFVNDF